MAESNNTTGSAVYPDNLGEGETIGNQLLQPEEFKASIRTNIQSDVSQEGRPLYFEDGADDQHMLSQE